MSKILIVEARCPICGTHVTYRKVVESDDNEIRKSIRSLLCLFCYAQQAANALVDLSWLQEHV